MPVFRLLGPDRELLGEIPLPEKGEISIGRAETNDIVVRDPSVSRRHATVCQNENSVEWCDAGSANGTWLGGEKIECHCLSHGDRLRIGSTTLVFLCKKQSFFNIFSTTPTPSGAMPRVEPCKSVETGDYVFNARIRDNIGSGDTPELAAGQFGHRRRWGRVWIAVGVGVLVLALMAVLYLLLRG